MLKNTKLITLVTIGFFISATAAQACNVTAGNFNWPSGWEESVKQMPTKSAKAKYTLSEKLRTLKNNRSEAKKK